MKPNCMKCKFFYVTWDPNKPKGCKYFGFKSYVMPSSLVFKSSGADCHAFENKK